MMVSITALAYEMHAFIFRITRILTRVPNTWVCYLLKAKTEHVLVDAHDNGYYNRYREIFPNFFVVKGQFFFDGKTFIVTELVRMLCEFFWYHSFFADQTGGLQTCYPNGRDFHQKEDRVLCVRPLSVGEDSSNLVHR